MSKNRHSSLPSWFGRGHCCPTRVVGAFQCNCRLLICPKTGEAALVDPGDDAQGILEWVSELRTPSGAPLKLKYLFQTHAHLDHIGATRGVKEGWVRSALPGVPLIALHKEDEFIYKMLQQQGQMFGFEYEQPLPIDHFFNHGERLTLGELKLDVIHTPGHSPGGVSLRLHEDSALGVEETVFTGDTLFFGSVGRTDLWGADQEQMFDAIRERLFTLDDLTFVAPGHGPDSLIGIEKRENPFLKD